MQTIDPTYVSFEQAKLLKEKGFNEVCKMCMTDEDHTSLPFNTGNSLHRNSKDPYYSVPEQWQVVEWLRVNHSIWLFITPDIGLKSWNFNIRGKRSISNTFSYDSPQEAYSAGFDYVLNNLI